MNNKHTMKSVLILFLILLSLSLPLGCPAPITPKTSIKGTFSYNALSATYGDAQTGPAIWNPPSPTPTATYTIAPKGTTDTTDTDVTINKNSGAVTIAKNAPQASTRTYTVRATGSGNFTGTATADIDITVKHLDLSERKLTYENVTGGTDSKTLSAVWTSPFPDKKTGITYTIVRRDETPMENTGVTIDKDSGEVTIVANPTLASIGTYTVRATGSGNFTGTATADIVITIEPLDLSDKLSYDPITATYGDAETGTAIWNPSSPAPTATYTIARKGGTPEGTTDTGVTIDEGSGAVAITKTTPTTSTGTYTVTAEGSGNFTGTATANIAITIETLDLSEKELLYKTITVNYGNEDTKTSPATWTSPFPDEETGITYAIARKGGTPTGATDTGVEIDKNLGDVTFSHIAPLTSIGTYTVKATGSGNFTGTAEADIDITLDLSERLSYDSLSATYGDTAAKTSPAKWTSLLPDQQAGITYTIARKGVTPPGATTTGVEIDKNLGEVTIKDTAPTTSAGTYTVTADGSGNFTAKADIVITIDPLDLSNKTLSYATITATYGDKVAETGSAIWTPTLPDQQAGITYTIARKDGTPTGTTGTGVEIDENSGGVTIKDTAPTTSAGTYTVTADGSDNFTGTTTADIVITIGPLDLSEKELNYDDITSIYGVTAPETSSARWTSPLPKEQKGITYTIEREDGNLMGTSVTIDEESGEVTIVAGPPMKSAGTYIVTATGTGNYSGSATGEITVKIANLHFKYGDKIILSPKNIKSQKKAYKIEGIDSESPLKTWYISNTKSKPEELAVMPPTDVKYELTPAQTNTISRDDADAGVSVGVSVDVSVTASVDATSGTVTVTFPETVPEGTISIPVTATVGDSDPRYKEDTTVNAILSITIQNS